MRASRWLLSILIVTVVGACRRPTTNTAIFSLKAPERVSTVAGVAAAVGVEVVGANGQVALSVDGLPAGVTATFDPQQTSSTSKLVLTVPDTTPAQTATLTLHGRAGDVESTAAVTLTVSTTTLALPTQASPITVTLEKLFYAAGDEVRAVVDLGTLTPPATVPDLLVSSSDALDAEHIALVRGEGNTFRTQGPLPIEALTGGIGTQDDGRLQLKPGDVFFVFFAVDKTQPVFAAVEATLVADFGFLDGPARAETPSRVDPALALTPDEAAVSRPPGTLLRRNELPVQVAARELIAIPESPAQLAKILALTQGTVVDEQPATEDDSVTAYLIEVTPGLVTTDRLSRMRAFVGESGELAASSTGALDIYGLVLQLRLEGFPVAVNPRLQPHAAPTSTEGEPLNLNMQNVGRNGATTPCVPNDVDGGNPCVRNVPALWSYMSLMDRDTQRVRVGVLDMGFAPHADFRQDTDGGFAECDMTSRPPRCAPGAARGVPTVGASGVGPLVWHGTGVVTALGGVVNDGFGGAGTGGQVAVPMLYKFDLLSYVFDMGGGVRRAVTAGAQVINISAGYPCSVVTNVGPDLDLCTPLGRAAICAVTSAALTAAALFICTGPIALIPIAGAIACGVATTAAVVATGACLTALGANAALGDPREPMRAAMRVARTAGVPVVVSAGNVLDRDSFPEVIRDYINLGDRSTNRWGIVPAMFPEVIVAGAADQDLNNNQFFGDRVDLWAPIFTRFTKPSDATNPDSPLDFGNFGGTSDSAPFIAGVIAAMQAVNPALNPKTTSLTAVERAALTERVRTILRDTAWTNAQLVALGYGNQPVERPRLVNPLGAVMRAAVGAQPDLGALGYDTSINFSESVAPDDLPEQARVLTTAWTTGTIGGIAPAQGVSPAPDRDHVKLAAVSNGVQMVSQELDVRWLGNDPPLFSYDHNLHFFDRATVPGLSGDEWRTTYRVLTRQTDATFAVTALAGQDFPWRIRLGEKVNAVATVTITNPVPDASARFCTNESVVFAASAFYAPSSLGETRFNWSVNGTLAQSNTATYTRAFAAAGNYRVTADAGGGSGAIDVVVEACTVAVRITAPTMNVSDYPTGSDGFLAVSLTGQATDGAGVLLPMGGLTFEWYTNRGDVQPGAPATGPQLLGTGPTLNAQFWAEGGAVSTLHELTLVVKQGGVVLGTSPVKRIEVLQLI